jgi:hypothetical protein
MSGKFALIIGNTEYSDAGLAQLTAPSMDAKDLARVLHDPSLCGFDEVRLSLNQLSSTVIEAIDEFFDTRKPDDLLVLYFSGHGIRDEFGSLHLAFKNTIRTRLRSTAIKADYIREAMDQSRSKRQILILDCCNSGAFPQGTKAELGGTMGMVNAFQGYGRYVLTASDATQFAWEGDKVIGKTDNSLFTHFLVHGLEGEADNDADGRITVDDLYDYAFEEISKVMPNQTPTKSASKQAGDIVLRQITRLEDIKAVSLPDELLEAMGDSRTFVREGSVEQLARYLGGKNLGLARSAKEALEKMVADDDSLRVRTAAGRALAPFKEAEAKAAQTAPAAAPAVEMAAAPAVVPEPAEEVTPPKSAQPEAQPVPATPLPKAAALESPESAAPEARRIPSMSLPKVALPSVRRPALIGAGLLVAAALVIAAIALSPHPESPGQQNPTQAPSTAPSATQGAALIPVGGSPEAASPSPDTSESQPAATLPGTSVAAGVHLTQPVDVKLTPGLVVYHDSDSSGTGSEQRAPDESYQRYRLERPFLKDMTYVPDLDILTFSLAQEVDWDYVSIQLAGSNPNNPLGIDYGVEVDTNNDGYGDFLIWAHGPYPAQWDTSTVQVRKDSNHDTGAWMSSSDAQPQSDGYDTVLFDGSTSGNADPDLAWVRMVQGSQAVVQFAFKKSGIGSAFVWGAVADAGLKDAGKFDYRNWFTQQQAGSPVRSSQYYPLGSLYAIDNTCWAANGLGITGGELKDCPAPKVTTGKGGSGGHCGSGGGGCPAGQSQDPVTCLCH